MKLKEEQYIMIKQYSELLDTVEEAFEYILESFENLEKTEGNRLLIDIFHALPQIARTNEQIQVLFEKKNLPYKKW